MEESSRLRTANSVPGEDSNDWRTEFTPDIRRSVVHKILGFVTLPPDTLSHTAKFVQNFEEKAFRNARSKEEYKQTISRGLKKFDETLGHRSAGVSSPEPGLQQTSMAVGGGQSSTLKNVHRAPSELAGKSAGQEMQSNISAHKQRDIPGTQPSQRAVYQHHYPQQLEHQFLKHDVHQQNLASMHIEDIRCGHHHQQQHIVSKSNPLQFSQNQTLPTVSRQPPFTEESSTAVFLPNQLVAQGDNTGQQLFPFRKTMPNTFQQPDDGLQRNSSCLQQQHRVIGPELKAMNMKSHEHSAHILQVENRSLQPKVGQSVQAVNNFHQLLDSTRQSKKEAAHQRPETLPQIVNNHQKVLPSQKTIAEASCASTTPNEQANMEGLRDRLYQKFLSMGKEYLPCLTYLHNKMKEKYQKQPIQEIDKKRISATERLIKYFSTSRGDFVRCSIENLESYQQEVKQFCDSIKQSFLSSAQQYTKLQPPGGQSQMPQLQKHSNYPVNLAGTSKPVGQSPLSLTQQVVLSSQPDMMNSARSGSLMELKQQNTPTSLHHAAGPEVHDFAGTQQIKSFLETTGWSHDCAKKLQQRNSVINAFLPQRQLKHQMMQPQISRQHMQPQLSQSLMKTHHMQMANATSQMSQHSSSEAYQKNSPLLKSGTPLYSSNSPSILSSPSTPLTSFSEPPDYVEHPSDASHLLIPEKFGPPKFLPVARPSKSASILHTESASPNDNQQSFATKEPLKRLVKAVLSLSPKALNAAVSEIGSTLKMVDVIAGTSCNDSRADVNENLASEACVCIHGRNSSLHCRCSFETKMKRKTNAIALDETDILKQSTSRIWHSHSSEVSRIKRRRIEPSNTLLDEIKCINQQLLETVIDLDSTEETAALDAGEGTVVRCVYGAVAFNENLRSQIASQMIPLPLRLFVPASYPNASPVILGGLSFDGSSDSKEAIDLSEKTRLRFSLSVRKLSEPFSLAELAVIWDHCARTVLLECAQSVGGGCFSSKYGKWEKCVPA